MKSKLGQVNKDVVLITGVSSGIGHQLVNRFLNDGYVVIAIGRQIDQPPFNVKEEYLENLVYIPFDYSDYEILIGTLKTYLSRASIGILFNNAGRFDRIVSNKCNCPIYNNQELKAGRFIYGERACDQY
jgi:NADP-dependent 3-hydroxy acid dehydrogenase YdfG